jgi:hypothetical protein
MSRRRYLSTEISTDKAINQLARTSDFAALFYTWLIPHAEDDSTFDADPEELLMRVCPGRRDKDIADIQAVVDLLLDMRLIERCDDPRRLRFPSKSFYKYQSYIKEDRRGAAATAQAIEPEQPTAQNSANQRTTAQNAASFSSSFSSSLSDTSANAENATVAELVEHYRGRIQSGAKLTDKARKKVALRLKEFTLDQLKSGVDKFSQDGFSMENNSQRGIAWWFHSEDRVLGYINMKPRPRPDNRQNGHAPDPDAGRLPNAVDIMADMARRSAEVDARFRREAAQ